MTTESLCIDGKDHQLEYHGTHDRETTYVCKFCPYVELQYVECDGL